VNCFEYATEERSWTVAVFKLNFIFVQEGCIMLKFPELYKGCTGVANVC
jgi:hypothetical protein